MRQRTWWFVVGTLLPGLLLAISWERQFVSEGMNPDDGYGASLARVGDVNGDGYEDFAVGSPGYNAKQGAVAVLYGGPGMDGTPDLWFTGENLGDEFGTSVAGGDLNGDGFPELIIGAPGYHSDSGAVYLYHGPSYTAYSKLVGDSLFARMGTGVAYVGDVTGDGHGDFLLEVHHPNDRVELRQGNNLNQPIPLVSYQQTDLAEFGSIGDLNRDGYPEFLCIYSSDSIFIYEGVKFLEDTTPSFHLEMGSGLVIASFAAGDVDGDGIPDVMLGDISSKRYVYLFRGRDIVFWGRVTPADSFPARAPGGIWISVGDNIVTADINGDGYDDLIGVSSGVMLVYLGGDPVDTLADLVLLSGSEDPDWGHATLPLYKRIVSAGDINGDGYEDLLVGGRNTATLLNFYLYRFVAPQAGATWAVGAEKTVRWMGQDLADLSLSVDGGATWTLLAEAVGGAVPPDTNEFTLRVPHLPSRYARIRLRAGDQTVLSDSFFTINATVTLLRFSAEVGDGGQVALSWQTDPGPEDLAGYHVYRLLSDGTEERVTEAPLRTMHWAEEYRPGVEGYALGAVNGWGHEYRLGEVSLLRMQGLVSVTPAVVKRGVVRVNFVVPDGGWGGLEPVEISLVDGTGRVVQQVDLGSREPGVHQQTLDLRRLGSGVYFVMVKVGEWYRRSQRVVVLQ